MSTATQQRTYTTGLNVTAAILNTEFGNIITNLNTLYGFIDDNTGSAPITVDTTNTYVGIGETSPTTALEIDGASITGLSATEPLFLIKGGSNNERIQIDSYGALGSSGATLQGVGATGTVASPGATDDDHVLIQMQGKGYDNASTPALTGNRASLKLRAAENWTTTNQGTKMTLDLTQEGGSTSSVEVLEWRYGSAGNVTMESQQGDMAIGPVSNGQVLNILKHPRVSHTTATYVNSHIQSGWSYIQGDGSNAISGTSISYPVPFASDNIRLLVSYAGYKTGSNPSDEGDITALDPLDDILVAANPSSASSFNAIMRSKTVVFGATNRYLFHWIAIGPTA